jgi:hypothetical protein
MPTVREALSASVAATDLFADEPVGLGIVVHSGAGIAFSASSTVAVAGLGDAGRASGTNEFGTGANLAMAGRLAALMRSSVFIDTAMEPAATRAAQTAATGLQTVQGASMLTVYQALRDPAAVEDQTIERYAIAAPATAGPGPATADLLRLPLKISSSYGFLNSSLTVFSDDFGSFGGIGQSFNGLTALAMAEPASLFVVAVSLLGLAGLRRWRLWA